MTQRTPVRLGLERATSDDPPRLLRDPASRIGLLLNQASLDASFATAAERLAARYPGRIQALFGPQHGLWSEQQDDMIETPHAHDPVLDVPIYSLYADEREPSTSMLADVDVLVVDLQDVGTRVYTYVWTLQNCLRTCARAGVAVCVLDRPNPVGGRAVEGPRIQPGFESFVGGASIPMRHALTIGELARLLVTEECLDVDLDVVPIDGWEDRRDATAITRPWIPTSPNLPRLEGVLVYPGQVLLEGTNLSEGRGTTTPFEVLGAPFLDGRELATAIPAALTPGLVLRPYRFEPTFHKWAGSSCGGVFLHVDEPERVRSYRTTLALLNAVAARHGTGFAWRKPGYEYETERPPIDVITGSASTRTRLDGRADTDLVLQLATADVDAWAERVAPHLLYGDATMLTD